MRLTLSIENYDFLEDGGPLNVTVDGRGLVVGRDGAMDWTLPDPARHISSQHFEITFQNGVYWLSDTSTNGTYLQGQTHRVDSPYQLGHGDRLQVGHYIILVSIEGEAADWQSAALAASSGEADPWSLGSPPKAPIDVTPEGNAPWNGDFGDNFIVNPAPPPTPTPPVMPANSQPAGSPFSQPASEGFAHGGNSAMVATPPLAASSTPSGDVILRAFCEGAGLDARNLPAKDPVELARELGQSLRVASEELKALLGARAATKQFVKSGSRTMMGQSNNNPLKFMPDALQAMEVMFLSPRPGYLDGTATLVESFADIKRHQTAVYSAIQPALAKLLEDLSPEAIEKRAGGGMLGGGKRAKCWDTFVERWDAKTHPYENGMLDVFLTYFAESYDASIKASGGR